MTTIRQRTAIAAIGVVLATAGPRAHSGPPFPIVPTRDAGAYRVSVWSDPDSTDDGSAAGKFWVTLRAAGHGVTLPAETRVTVAVVPSDGKGAARTALAEATPRDPLTYFAALVLDHEGPFAVHVAIDGPLGAVALDASVDATYDLRPPRWLVVIYLIPFLAVGFLWIKLLLRRRRVASQPH
jgi:hypothetical protein